MNCPICCKETSKLWSNTTWKWPISTQEFQLAVCSYCESIFCTPRPNPEQLKMNYEKFYEYDWYEKVSFLKKIQGWHRWQRVKKWVGKNTKEQRRILDIGCGHGMFLFWAKKAGWDHLGIDYPSLATCHAKEKFGFKIIESDIESFFKNPSDEIGQFDLITLWHVLEHTSDPISFLSKIPKLLKPSGKLLIGVPNAKCPGMQKRKEQWVWCQPPYVHTVHFSPIAVLSSTGLPVGEWRGGDTYNV